ncbi:7TM diverse intracellular signaling domain-containing protein [Paenibacillus sp. y28]
MLILAGCTVKPPSFDMAKQGVADLRGWSFMQQGPVNLDGEWAFYWQKLLSPEQWREAEDSGAAPDWIEVPGSWNEQVLRDGTVLPGEGYGTYRLRVLLPQNGPPAYAITVPGVSTAYRLWANGELVIQSGEPGTNREDAVAEDSKRMVILHEAHGEVDLILQASNFEHRRGGVWQPIKIGTPPQLQLRSLRLDAADILVFSCLLVVGLYHLAFYALRRETKTPLFFGLFCLITGLRSLLVGEYVLGRLWPHFPYAIDMKLEYMTIIIGIPLFVRFIHSLYPEPFHRLMLIIPERLCLGCAVFVAVTPTIVFTQWLLLFQTLALVMASYLVYAIVCAIRSRQEGAWLIGLGFVLYALSVLNDILYFNETLWTGSYSPIGLLLLIFVQAVALARKIAGLFADLVNINASLEQKIKERTRSLEESEEARRYLVSNISHELRTPLTSIRGYVEAILDGVVRQPEQQEKTLRLVQDKTLTLQRLVEDLFELARLEARQSPFHFQALSVDQVKFSVQEKYEFDAESAGISLTVHGPGERVCIWADSERLEQVFTNLIFNAIKYTPAGGKITVRMEIQQPAEKTENDRLDERPVLKEHAPKLLITVEDTGKGIRNQDLPYIFDRFYRGDPAAPSSLPKSGGLGLAITKEIVQAHGGCIWAEASADGGSRFCFTVPIKQEEQTD